MESQEKNWREFAKGTSDRGGRERDLEDYEFYLGFDRKDLEGKTILDLGSGETEMFSRDLKNAGINAEVISLNPDYTENEFRSKIKKQIDWTKKSIAGIGQELPFKTESFDRVFALYSVAVFSSPRSNPEAARHWMQEIVRVLKRGGEARIGGLLADNPEEVLVGPYGPLINELKNNGYDVGIENLNSEDDPTKKLWDARMIIKKSNKQNAANHKTK